MGKKYHFVGLPLPSKAPLSHTNSAFFKWVHSIAYTNIVERSYSIKSSSVALYGGWKQIGNNRYTIAYKLRAPLSASNVVSYGSHIVWKSPLLDGAKARKVVCCKPHKVHWKTNCLRTLFPRRDKLKIAPLRILFHPLLHYSRMRNVTTGCFVQHAWFIRNVC